MIKFFRKIRQNLLIENKTGKYFKYAIGEIILVVIGILIALQINNWNEQRKRSAKTIAIFNQIIDELVVDVQIIQDANKFYLDKISLIKLYSNSDFKSMESESPNEIAENDLVNMIRTYASINIHDRGFDLLMNYTDELDSQYKEYIDDLVFLYQDTKSNLDFYNKQLKTMLFEHRMHMIKNHSWYSADMGQNERMQAEYKYYKYDPTYRNFVKFYNEMIRNIVIPARLFEDDAIKFCRKVNDDFNLDRKIDEKLSYLDPPQSLLSSIQGKYLNTNNNTLIFDVRKKQLYESTYDNIKTHFEYSYEKDFKTGELRYLGDSTFYRNVYQNLKLNSDGTLSLYKIFQFQSDELKRIEN